jgi:putative cell wall-binding protein
MKIKNEDVSFLKPLGNETMKQEELYETLARNIFETMLENASKIKPSSETPEETFYEIFLKTFETKLETLKSRSETFCEQVAILIHDGNFSEKEAIFEAFTEILKTFNSTI